MQNVMNQTNNVASIYCLKFSITPLSKAYTVLKLLTNIDKILLVNRFPIDVW